MLYNESGDTLTILDYVKKYNYTFEEKEFNEVDNLIFATLIYADMNKLIGKNEKITLGELSDRFFENYKKIKR